MLHPEICGPGSSGPTRGTRKRSGGALSRTSVVQAPSRAALRAAFIIFEKDSDATTRPCRAHALRYHQLAALTGVGPCPADRGCPTCRANPPAIREGDGPQCLTQRPGVNGGLSRMLAPPNAQAHQLRKAGWCAICSRAAALADASGRRSPRAPTATPREWRSVASAASVPLLQRRYAEKVPDGLRACLSVAELGARCTEMAAIHRHMSVPGIEAEIARHLLRRQKLIAEAMPICEYNSRGAGR